MTNRQTALLAAMMACASITSMARAADSPRYAFDLAAQPLKYALRSVTHTAHLQLLATSHALDDRQAPALHGNLTVQEALDAILKDSGLVAEISGRTVFVRGRSIAPDETVTRPAVPTIEIVVTGSRIHGSTPASPVIRLTQKQLEDEGFNNLGDAVRSIPENFAGGQNPGVAGGGAQGASNQNISSSSTLNLRGLGSDATLTLLNGHRMPYDGVAQGVDISSIPLAALDRIEIVTDGASAIYGSDAVGGVANVILKPDYDGLRTSARIGGATDGGDFQQQYDGVAGTRWQDGGILGAFDYSHSSGVYARERDYTQILGGSTTLIPNIRQYSALLAGHQAIGEALRFDIDATYNKRNSSIQTPSTTTDDFRTNGVVSFLRLESYSISPRMTWTISPAWQAYVTGTYGSSANDVTSPVFSGGQLFLTAIVHYRDQLGTAEGGLEGRLLSLPAGDMRLAAGGGYRDNILTVKTQTRRSSSTSVLSDFVASRDSSYGFAELNVPLVSPVLKIPGIYRLTANAAGRYERYPGIGSITTPKLGLIYAPIPDLDLKGSWGRSFKAPTLYQQFNYKAVLLSRPSVYGATGYPPGSTVLDLAGGNPDGLRPERARTWTATLALHPRILPGAELEVSYFHIAYRDRIISPIQSAFGALTNPIYQNFITFSPTPTQVAAAIAGAPAGVNNQTGAPFDPSTVVAIIDGREHNSARQTARGVDIHTRYRIDTAGLGQFILDGAASYLDSRQLLIAGQPTQQLAGIIFNPPHWRARAGIDWHLGDTSASLHFNRIGGEIDNRRGQMIRLAGLNTVDLAVGTVVGAAAGPLKGLSVSLTVSNLLNAKPAPIVPAFGIDPSYDSTNYSAVGRFVGATIARSW